MIKSGNVPICLKNHKAQEIMIRGITPIKDRIIYSMQKFDFQFKAICETVSNVTKQHYAVVLSVWSNSLGCDFQ